MNTIKPWITAALIACAIPSAHAAIYKCQQGSQTVYSDKPCPNAQSVNTTNATSPNKADVYNAQARKLRDEAKINEAAAEKERQREMSERCASMAVDHNYLMNRANKYTNDPWWKKRAIDSAARLERECSKYLIPAGAQ
jgi:hypothetical protein